MKRNKSFASLLGLAAFAAVLVPGCSGTSSSASSVVASSSPTSSAVSSVAPAAAISFLNFKPEVADNYSVITAAYKSETGLTVNVTTAASGQYDTTLTAQMGTANKPDIFQINGPVGYNKWKDYCSDLTNSDLYKNLSDKSLAVMDSGKCYAVPNTVEGYGIIYNKALTDKYFALTNKASTITETSMDQVKSYVRLKAVIEDMTAHKTDLGVNGVFAATSLKTGEQWRWQTHLFNMPISGEYGKITAVPSTLSFTYQQNYRNLFDLYLNNSTTALNQLSSIDTNQSMSEVALGQAIMVQNGNWGAGQITGNAGNIVKSTDIKFLPLYMGDMGTNVTEATQGLCVGTENYLVINNKVAADKQAAASKFLNWLYLGNGKKYVAMAADKTTGGLGFIPTFTGYTGDLLPSDPLSKEVMNWMGKDGVKSVPWTFNYIPSENVKNTLGTGLLNYANANLADATWTSDVVNATKAKWATDAAALLG